MPENLNHSDELSSSQYPTYQSCPMLEKTLDYRGCSHPQQLLPLDRKVNKCCCWEKLIRSGSLHDSSMAAASCKVMAIGNSRRIMEADTALTGIPEETKQKRQRMTVNIIENIEQVTCSEVGDQFYQSFLIVFVCASRDQ